MHSSKAKGLFFSTIFASTEVTWNQKVYFNISNAWTCGNAYMTFPISSPNKHGYQKQITSTSIGSYWITSDVVQDFHVFTLSEIHFDTFGEDHDNGRIVRVLDIVPWRCLKLQMPTGMGFRIYPVGIEIPPRFWCFRGSNSQWLGRLHSSLGTKSCQK